MSYCKTYSEYKRLAKEKRLAREEILTGLKVNPLDPDDNFVIFMGHMYSFALVLSSTIVGFCLSRYIKTTALSHSISAADLSAVVKVMSVLPLLNVAVRISPRDNYMSRYLSAKYMKFGRGSGGK